jgi:hypothetical protein
VAVELGTSTRTRQPVVVAAVQDHGVVVADVLVRQQLRELLGVDEVAPPVRSGPSKQPDGACDVTAFVADVFVDPT